jgi:hypothetical protein
MAPSSVGAPDIVVERNVSKKNRHTYYIIRLPISWPIRASNDYEMPRLVVCDSIWRTHGLDGILIFVSIPTNMELTSVDRELQLSWSCYNHWLVVRYSRISLQCLVHYFVARIIHDQHA